MDLKDVEGIFITIFIFIAENYFTAIKFVSQLPLFFNLHAAVKRTTTTPLSLFKSGGAKKDWKVGEGSANNARLGGYVPDGISPEQYAKVKAEEKAKAEKSKKKFKIGKQVETLTEWQAREQKKFGAQGANIRKGHRLVKAKYEEFYTTENVEKINRGQ